MTKPSWPPSYSVRISKRTKRIFLKLSVKGLEIVTPSTLNQKKIMSLLDSRKEWIQRNWQLTSPSPSQKIIPKQIHLALINEDWQVNLLSNSVNEFQSIEAEKKIYLSSGDESTSFLLLKKWLQQKAKIHLHPLLSDCSIKYNLPFRSLKIGAQQTRWGSCSSLKNINLNCKLLLLPFDIVHYIIVHELIHTIHFDHSSRFWTAVKAIIPDYRFQKTALKKLEIQLPDWIN